MLLPGKGVLVGVCGEFGLVRSLISFGLPRPNVLFGVVLSRGSGVFGLSVSIIGVSDPLSDAITIARFCLDGDLINRPSGPLGPIPPLLCSWLKSEIGLLTIFICNTFPVWFSLQYGLYSILLIVVYRNMHFQFCFVGFFLRIKKDKY